MRESMQIIVVTFVAVLLVTNLVATAMVLRSETATPAQKTLQSCLVWLLPFLGAFVVIVFHRLDSRSQGPESERMRLDGSEIDVGLAARHDSHN
jgi:hypothetical protein